MESFNLTQSICDATHRYGHTLDFVLSMGLSISNVVIVDNCISDHRSLTFNIDLPAVILNNRSADCYFHPVNEFTAKRFAEAYETSPGPAIIEASVSSPDIEVLTAVLNSVCVDIMNDVAPLRLKKSKPQSQPCLMRKLMLLDGPVGKLNVDGEKTGYRFLMRC